MLLLLNFGNVLTGVREQHLVKMGILIMVVITDAYDSGEYVALEMVAARLESRHVVRVMLDARAELLQVAEERAATRFDFAQLLQIGLLHETQVGEFGPLVRQHHLSAHVQVQGDVRFTTRLLLLLLLKLMPRGELE